MTNPTASSIRDRYLAALLSHPAVATVSSFGSKPVSVEAVYLPRTLLQEVQRNVQQKASGRAAERNELQPAHEADRVVTEELPIDLWPKVKTDRVVLIEGPAGMGKSTLTKHLVQESYAQHHKIPIWIPFRTLVASARPLRDHLEQDYIPWLGLADVRVPQAGPDHVSLGQWLYDQWGSGQAVLILDGLDEVINPTERANAFRNLPWMGPDSSRQFTILTSRPLGHGLPLVTAKIELQGLTPQEQIELINRYQSRLGLDDPQIEQFKQQVGLSRETGSSSRSVLSLLQRPGHLVAILRVYAKTGHVLETETEVLAHLLEARLTGRSESSADLAKKRQVLEGLALHLLACRQGQAQSRAQLLALLEQVLQEYDAAGTPPFPLSQAPALLNDFVHNTGLLTRLGLEPERYQFESVIWQEYLAGGALANTRIMKAMGLTEEQVLKFLGKKAWDPEWEWVLKGWLGHTDNPFPLFERLMDKAKDDLARHRLGTAGRCLFEVKPALRDRPEYQTLSLQIPTEAFEVWKTNAERNTHKLLETSLRKSWVETDVGQKRLLVLLESPNEQVRNHVIEVFAKLGSAMPEPIQEALMMRLKDGDRAQAWWALQMFRALGSAISVRMQEALIMQLVNDDPYVRALAAEILGALGENMQGSVQQALIAKLVDEDRAVRWAAVQALGKLGAGMPESVQQALERRLVYDEESIQEDVAELLKSLGSVISDATQEALMVQLRDENLDVCTSAVRVLGTLGRGMPERVQKALMARLVDADWYTHLGMVHAIRHTLGSAMPELMKKALMVQLMDEGLEVRRRAVRVLGTLGRAMPGQVQQTLLGWLANEHRGMRRVVAEALGALGSGMRESVQEALVARLVDEDRLVRQATVEALGNLGAGMRESVQEALVARLADEDRLVRQATVEALGKLGAGMRESVQQALIERLRDDHQGVRYMAVKVSGILGQAMLKPLQEALVARLTDEDGLVRRATMEALGKLGAGMRESVQEALVARLVDDDEVVRFLAVQALGALGQTMSKSVQKSLVGKLGDNHDFVRLTSVRAFQSVGVFLDEMVQAVLLGRLEHAHESEREAVAKVLSSLQQQGLRFFHANHALSPGRLVSILSAMPLFSDCCNHHEPMRRSFTLVPLDV